MKRLLYAAVFFAAALVGTIPGTPARADDGIVIQAQGNPYLVDFISLQGKRADLRVKVTQKGLDAVFTEWLRAEHPSQYQQFAESQRDKTANVVQCCCAMDQQAQRNPNLIDFLALSAKRADLRANITRKGLDAALDDWLRTERPHLYHPTVQQACCR